MLGALTAALSLSLPPSAEVVVDKANGAPTKGLKEVQPHIVEAAAKKATHHAGGEEEEEVVAAAAGKAPVGVRGDYPIAFGGGQQGVGASVSHP